MKTEAVSFPAQDARGIRLEGELLDGGGRACVVSHPHPLAGGDMDHPVSAALWRAAGEAGFKALRYNFRGVGRSTGELTSRSPLPLADLAGAIDFCGETPVLAIGYSFGARTTLHAILAGEAIERAALVALPSRTPAGRAAMTNLLLGRRLRAEDYDSYPDPELVAECPAPVLVLAGTLDPLVEAERFRAHGVEPVLFDGLNHFFSRRRGHQPPLAADLDALARRTLAFLGNPQRPRSAPL